MKPDLKSVPTELPDAPYPPNTRCNGWRFEVDFERIKRCDTWILAKPEQRPWLLMTWVVAFDQIPAGSLPDNHALIGAMLGMDEAWVSANASILLRGFKLHSDGRLYHPVVVERMQALLNYRDREASRKRAYREKMSRGTDTGQTRTSGGVPTQEQEQEQEQEQKEQVANATRQTPKGDLTIARANGVPFSKITALWGEVCPHLPQPVLLTDARKSAIRARWNAELPDLDAWRECFEQVKESDFLSGRVSPGNGRKPFRATLDWVAKLDNTVKIYEGKYRNEKRR